MPKKKANEANEKRLKDELDRLKDERLWETIEERCRYWANTLPGKAVAYCVEDNDCYGYVSSNGSWKYETHGKLSICYTSFIGDKWDGGGTFSGKCNAAFDSNCLNKIDAVDNVFSSMRRRNYDPVIFAVNRNKKIIEKCTAYRSSWSNSTSTFNIYGYC